MKDKLITLAALFAIAIPLGTILDGAKAQYDPCLQWGRDQYGNRVCMQNDAVNRVWVTPEKPPPVTGDTAITHITEHCEQGWTLVADQSMHPMCARELKEPKR